MGKVCERISKQTINYPNQGGAETCTILSVHPRSEPTMTPNLRQITQMQSNGDARTNVRLVTINTAFGSEPSKIMSMTNDKAIQS